MRGASFRLTLELIMDHEELRFILQADTIDMRKVANYVDRHGDGQIDYIVKTLISRGLINDFVVKALRGWRVMYIPVVDVKPVPHDILRVLSEVSRGSRSVMIMPASDD